MSEASGAPDRGALPREPAMLAHLVVLWGFAVVQPTLSTLSESVEFFFPLRRVDGWPFVAMLLVLAAGPPALLWGAGALAGRLRAGLRRPAHLGSVGLLAAAFGAYLLREAAPVGLPLSVAVSILAGAGFAWAYARFGGLRSAMTVLTPAPAVFLAAFLLFTNASHLVFPGDSAATAARSAEPTPVVLLLLDELPASSLMLEDESLDAERFPGLARMAEGATWYRNALTASWTTFSAVPAILTGREPDPDDLPVVSDHPENVFTLLRRTHAEHVIESFTRLCPLVVCPNDASAAQRLVSLASAMSLVYVNVILPRRSGLRAPNPGNTWGAVLTALDPKERIDPFRFETGDLRLFPGPQFERFLSTIRATPGDTRPPLYFLHSNLPHNPYNHLPSGRLYRDHDKEMPALDVNTEDWSLDVDGVVHGWQRHLLQAQYADLLVGRMIDRLEQAGVYEDALVIVVADHGAHFFAGRNRRKPRGPGTSDIAMVPLIVKYPGQQEGRIVDQPVSTLDVLPTIARETGVTLPWEPDGRPLPERGGSLVAAGGDGARAFRILDEDDEWQTLDPGALRRERTGIIELRERVLGHEPPGLFGVGPARELVGRAPGSAPQGPPVDLSVSLEDAEEYERVDPDGPFVPALVRGRLDGDRGPVASVAVAVNGRIAGAGMIRRQDGDTYSFSVMVPESSLRAGANDVRILGVSGEGPALRVHALRG